MTLLILSSYSTKYLARLLSLFFIPPLLVILFVVLSFLSFYSSENPRRLVVQHLPTDLIGHITTSTCKFKRSCHLLANEGRFKRPFVNCDTPVSPFSRPLPGAKYTASQADNSTR